MENKIYVVTVYILLFQPTATYLFSVRKLIVFNGWIVGTNYVVVLFILVVIYYKILKRIKELRIKHGQLT